MLALVSRLNFSPTTLYESYSGRGLLQFWRVPTEHGCEPEFEFGLSHEYGDLTSLEWCPSQPDGLLGLLAVGCSDGGVRLWSVPQLLPGEFYTRQPDLSLVWGEEVGQCLHINW